MCVVPSYLQRFAIDIIYHWKCPYIYYDFVIVKIKKNSRFIVKTNSFILSKIVKYAYNKIK